MLYFVEIKYSAAHFSSSKKAKAYVSAETRELARAQAVEQFAQRIAQARTEPGPAPTPYILDVDVAACAANAVFLRPLSF